MGASLRGLVARVQLGPSRSAPISARPRLVTPGRHWRALHQSPFPAPSVVASRPGTASHNGNTRCRQESSQHTGVAGSRIHPTSWPRTGKRREPPGQSTGRRPTKAKSLGSLCGIHGDRGHARYITRRAGDGNGSDGKSGHEAAGRDLRDVLIRSVPGNDRSAYNRTGGIDRLAQELERLSLPRGWTVPG